MEMTNTTKIIEDFLEQVSAFNRNYQRKIVVAHEIFFDYLRATQCTKAFHRITELFMLVSAPPAYYKDRGSLINSNASCIITWFSPMISFINQIETIQKSETPHLICLSGNAYCLIDNQYCVIGAPEYIIDLATTVFYHKMRLRDTYMVSEL